MIYNCIPNISWWCLMTFAQVIVMNMIYMYHDLSRLKIWKSLVLRKTCETSFSLVNLKIFFSELQIILLWQNERALSSNIQLDSLLSTSSDLRKCIMNEKGYISFPFVFFTLIWVWMETSFEKQISVLKI